jgi:hypothetical protein
VLHLRGPHDDVPCLSTCARVAPTYESVLHAPIGPARSSGSPRQARSHAARARFSRVATRRSHAKTDPPSGNVPIGRSATPRRCRASASSKCDCVNAPQPPRVLKPPTGAFTQSPTIYAVLGITRGSGRSLPVGSASVRSEGRRRLGVQDRAAGGARRCLERMGQNGHRGRRLGCHPVRIAERRARLLRRCGRNRDVPSRRVCKGRSMDAVGPHSARHSGLACAVGGVCSSARVSARPRRLGATLG